MQRDLRPRRLVTSAALFGILIGSPLGGWAGDKSGRKPLFMIDMALFLIGSLLQFYDPEVP